MYTNNQIIIAAARKVGTVQDVAGAPTLNGQSLATFTPVYAAAGIPGVVFRGLIANEDGDTQTDANADFLARLDSIWLTRIKPSGFLTEQQVSTARALIKVGVMVTPANESTIRNFDPAHSLNLFAPAIVTDPNKPNARAGWDSICAELREFTSLYYKKQFADAKAKGAELEADVAFWDTVYKTAADFPGNVAGFAASSILHFVGSIVLNPYVLMLGAVVVVGAIAYKKGGSVIAKQLASIVPKA